MTRLEIAVRLIAANNSAGAMSFHRNDKYYKEALDAADQILNLHAQSAPFEEPIKGESVLNKALTPDDRIFHLSYTEMVQFAEARQHVLDKHGEVLKKLDQTILKLDEHKNQGGSLSEMVEKMPGSVLVSPTVPKRLNWFQKLFAKK